MPNKPLVFIYTKTPESIPMIETPDIGMWECHDFELHLFNSSLTAEAVIALRRPQVIVTTGDARTWEELYVLPYFYRYKWIHVDEITEANRFDVGMAIYNCFINSSLIPGDNTLVTAFTSIYKTQDKKLDRLYRSLQAQTWRNWEWVIYNDSPGYSNAILEMILDDPRVTYVEGLRNTGIIGLNKRTAAMLGSGDILAEVDHDDYVMPDTFRLLVQGFKEFPQCGFYYTECIETHENGDAITYGPHAAFGYCKYHDVYVPEFGKVMPSYINVPVNGVTMRHIVGVPNHIRAWRKDVYHKLNGHNTSLYVADDYELIVRTFLETRFLNIPTLGYIQYYDDNRQTNTQDIRRSEIQRAVRYIESHYSKDITNRITELTHPDIDVHSRDLDLQFTMKL